MIPEQTLVAKLLATAGVTAIVSTRVYPGYRREGDALPAIVYAVNQDLPVNYAGGTTGTAEMKLTVYCLASSYSGAKALGAAVAAAMSGFVDSDGRVWHLDGMTEDIGEPVTGQDVPEYFAINQDYAVWH